jgi:uncharacterized protein involved in exopolysaccharide biosynthesis
MIAVAGLERLAHRSLLIAGISLSTTSVAVVYAVMSTPA